MRFRIILFIFLGICNLCHADTLNAQLSSEKIVFGDSVTLTFVLDSSSSNNNPNFSALEKDFHILSTNYGNSISMVNGSVSTKTFWRLTLEPRKAGAITIPEIDFGKVKSTAQKLIVEDTSAPIATGTGNAPAFVQAEISSTAPYIQSQVVYTFKLFYQSQLDNPKIEMPQIKDATFMQLGEGNQYQTTIKGDQYLVIEKSFAIFPQKPGDISIPPTYFRALTYDNNPNTMYDPFDVNTPKPLALATQTFTLAAQKIPTNYQGKTWLPAKNITLTEKWSTDAAQWEAGNPVTRTIIVVADGLRADQIPDLAIDKMADVNVYVDTPKRNNNLQSKSITGILEQKVTYIPNSSKSFTIPAIKLNWWNTEKNTNAISELNSKAVQVTGKINNIASTPIQSASTIVNPIQKPIAISKPEIKTIPFYLSVWFWIAIFIFTLWIMTLWLFWNKRSVKNIKTNNEKTAELNDKDFKHACEQGNAIAAQQFLLIWARNQWSDVPLNLEKLCEIVNDTSFKDALKNLEQAIYAKTVTPWNGNALFTAYQKMKKTKKHRLNFMRAKKKNSSSELLPPLHPR